MARQDVDIGVQGNDGTGDSIRESFRKVNENFQELYAVFGIGGQISFTDLSDVPDTYQGNENKIPMVRADSVGLNLVELASDNALTGDDDTIGFDFSEDGKLIIRQVSARIVNDPEPTLGGPLNAASQPVAGVSVSQEAIDIFNSVYGTNYDTGELVINKAFADQNYQEKQIAGSGIRLSDEPESADQYVLAVDNYDLGDLKIGQHGLTELYNGAEFIFKTTGTPPSSVEDGEQVYVRIRDVDTISLYRSTTDALNNRNKLILNGGDGDVTITDAAYDPSLEGNWLSTVAIPRKSAVRRQGDTMEGRLTLHDHPGGLEGIGLPNGLDDLQAATKLYVDNASASSQVNLYVTTSGNDSQENTPPGKEGRSPGYAYRTINSAARMAEELIEASPFETGPYLQTMTYDNGNTPTKVIEARVPGITTGRRDARSLIVANKEFIKKETVAYIDQAYPRLQGRYNVESFQSNIEIILDSVSLDSLLGDNANFLSRRAAMRYFSTPELRALLGTQRQQTVDSIEFARDLVLNNVLTNELVSNPYQDRIEQYVDNTLSPDINAEPVIDAKFDIIFNVISNNVLNAPQIVDGPTSYTINVSNGNFGFIDQASPQNTDLFPGKVIRGRTSGALGRIIDYKQESSDRPVSVPQTDEIEVQLLEPTPFVEDEELEFGNIVKNTQVSLNVESGIYEEDYPIKLPDNVSVKGDEFRRVLVRPKDRVSQSPWVNSYFYRDAIFDGLVLGSSSIEEYEVNAPYDSTRAQGTYTVDLWESSGAGHSAVFEVTVSSLGSVLDVTLIDGGGNFAVGDIITISDSEIGDTGALPIELRVTKVPNGTPYIDPIDNKTVGYFGYHYLANPGKLRNTGAGYENVGKWTVASAAVHDNVNFLVEQFVNYIEETYTSLVGTINKVQFQKIATDISHAIAKDLEFGNNEFTLEVQGNLKRNPSVVEYGTEVSDGIGYLLILVQDIIRGVQPPVLGTDNQYTFDNFNGDGDPDFWKPNQEYRVDLVVKNEVGNEVSYFIATNEHTSGDEFDSEEANLYWRGIDGPELVVSNLIDTIDFAFDEGFNPPLRNNQLDAFLMNDATMVRNVTVQGHGGFMCVLDPEGQILTKSPYIQTGSSFSQSINKQSFRGGMFVDAFVGNTAVQAIEKVDGSPFRLKLKSFGSQSDPQGLYNRRPRTPCVFYIDGKRFQVNSVTKYDPDQGTAEIVLDPSSNNGSGFEGITSKLTTGVDLDSVGEVDLDMEKFSSSVTNALRGFSYDVALDTNFNAVFNASSFHRRTDLDPVTTYLQETRSAFNTGKIDILDSPVFDDKPALQTETESIIDDFLTVTEDGLSNSVSLRFGDTTGIETNKTNARVLIQDNKSFILNEIISWIDTNYSSLVYNVDDFRREFEFKLDAASYDVQYGGNSASIRNAVEYFDGFYSSLGVDSRAASLGAFTQLESIVSDVVLGNYSGQPVSSNPASSTEVSRLVELFEIIRFVLEDNTKNAIPEAELPDTSWSTDDRKAVQVDISNRRKIYANSIVAEVDSPISITLQTAGNRSMLGNDFTQINDLGYGLVTVNGALSEMVSMFTYYCWTSYYAKNGSEIRSLTGSSCYGEYGLVAEGSDPNEIPDSIELVEDMVQPGKTFAAETVLTTSETVELREGDTIEQKNTLATATIAVDTSLVSGSRQLYLIDVEGIFDTENTLTKTNSPTADLGQSSKPFSVDNIGLTNTQESLSLYAYDFRDIPSNRSEIDIYHPERPTNARYEVANVELTTFRVAMYDNVGTVIPYVFSPGTNASGVARDAEFSISKTEQFGYSAEIKEVGLGYRVGDSYRVSGDQLGGISPDNDCTILVEEIDNGELGGVGAITEISVTGNVYVDATTPKYSNEVYKLNFSTGDSQFSDSGLLGSVGFNKYVNYRRNQTHKINDISRTEALTIRPSTAVIFDENPGYVYRSISFLTSDSIGNSLPDDTLQVGFDSTYDYIRLVVDTSQASSSDLNDTGKTLGSSAGDTSIAVSPFVDNNEIYRLNNNDKTPVGNRPPGWSTETLVTPSIFTWAGKTHYVFNYRGVEIINGDHVEVEPGPDNDYGLVDISDTGIEINSPTTSSGLAETIALAPGVVIRAGLKAQAPGNVTIKISTCRATSHDFLDIGTGGFNDSNYPNVIFGVPSEKDSSKEVDERGKGRVFYVSTDQDGIFRVGRFFSVDQGTGTVTFSASLALSDVDGLGFKRGVVITEFSTDSAMTDNASDTVPTELAVRSYVNRRLGYDLNGNITSNRIGPGVLAPDGTVPMSGDINAAGNTFTDLKYPEAGNETATKRYVDDVSSLNDELKDLKSLEYNDYDESQLLVSTGFKKLLIASDTIIGGTFKVDDEFTGTESGATGQIIDVKESDSTNETIEITYIPLSGTVSDGQQSNTNADTITVTNSASGEVVDGPIDEWANGVWSSTSDIQVSTSREKTEVESEVVSRFTEIDIQIKPNTIVNSDVNASAGILQSKLSLNPAITRDNSTGISQTDLGISSFDSGIFTTDTGWVSIPTAGLDTNKIKRVSGNTLLGNKLGTSSSSVEEVSFDDIVTEGSGLRDSDFADSNTISVGNDSGSALIKTGEGTYGITNVSISGSSNSIVKTDENGSIQVRSLILGGDENYEILALDSAALEIKTPAQGLVLRASGGSDGNIPTYPDVNIPGNISVGDESVANSSLKNKSALSDNKSVATNWLYSSFIETPLEKGNASSGVSIGADTGFTQQGQVAIVTADNSTSSSVTPFIFSSSGVVPDFDQAYDIGSASSKYDNVYANLFRGTATESYYADLAENYVADAVYNEGTVLMLGGENEVTVANEKGTHKVVGVVSSNPAHLMNSDLNSEFKTAVALQGRVPCKVIGKVRKGDLIISSSVPGYGMVNNDPKAGSIIGKSLENKDTLDRGVVEVVVGKH